ITPAIDLCEVIASRGNTTLENVLTLSTSLRQDIDSLSRKISRVSGSASSNPVLLDSSSSSSALSTTTTDVTVSGSKESPSKRNSTETLSSVVQDLKFILEAIEDLVPFLQLALQTSGAHLSTTLPRTVSPARLMQASGAITVAARDLERAYTEQNKTAGTAKNDEDKEGVTVAEDEIRVPVGPAFPVRLYSLFSGSVRAKSVVDWTWKEDFVKAVACVERVFPVSPPPAKRLNTPKNHDHDNSDSDSDDETTNPPSALTSTSHTHTPRKFFRYELVLLEDLNDGRYHDETELPSPSKKLATNNKYKYLASDHPTPSNIIPGRIRRTVVTDIQRLYYSSSGKLLNIGDARAPVIVLKINKGGGGGRKSEGDQENDSGDEGLGGETPGGLRKSTSSSSLVQVDPTVEWVALELHQEEEEIETTEDEDEIETETETENETENEREEEEEDSSQPEESEPKKPSPTTP
ncbi:hypothetical protein HK102_010820, partial [Quaeritorhiza haematococci]